MTAEAAEPVQLSADEVCRVVGERVREFRLGLGLTMERFAERAGLSLGMLSKIEHGQTSPSLATLTSLATAVGVPFTAFFLGLDEEHAAVIVPAGRGLDMPTKEAVPAVAIKTSGPAGFAPSDRTGAGHDHRTE